MIYEPGNAQYRKEVAVLKTLTSSLENMVNIQKGGLWLK